MQDPSMQSLPGQAQASQEPQGQPMPAANPADQPPVTFRPPPLPPRDEDDQSLPYGTMLPILPDELKDEEPRQRYAAKLCRWANSWIAHISPLYPRWEVNERLVIDQPETPKDLPWDGAQWTHIPVTSSKATAWQSFVCQPPTSTTPYGVSTIFGKDATRAKTVESDLYQFMLRGEFSRYFRRNTWATGLYGKSIWRVYLDYDEEDFPIFRYDDIAPRAWIMYPNVTEMRDARMLGHTYEVSVSEIRRLQDAGEMYEEPIIRGGKLLPERSPAGVVDNQVTTGTDEHSDDDDDNELQVRCAEVFVKEQWGSDKKPKWYLVRFAVDDEELLGIYQYPYSVPWYFDEFVHEEPQRFWPETSRINSIQSLQHATNAVFNQAMWVHLMEGFPPAFTPGWALDKKYSRYKPGAIVPTAPGAGSVSSIQSRGNIQASEVLMNNLDRRTDRSMRFSDQQLGAQVSGDTTATEADIKQKSSNMAATDDMANINSCIAKILKFQQELYRFHYPEFHDKYGDDLATQPDSTTYAMGYPKILGRPMQWELLGKTPDNAPMGQSHAMMSLIQSLQAFANPVLLMTLRALGIDVTEFIQSLVRNSNLNDRDIIVMSQDANPGGGIDQLLEQFQKSQGGNAPRGTDPQVEQAKLQIETQRLSLEQAKTQAQIQADQMKARAQAALDMRKLDVAQRDAILSDMVAIYDASPPDVRDQIVQALGLEPSTLHPVVAQALKDGAIHESILAPQGTAPTNGKSSGSIMRK